MTSFPFISAAAAAVCLLSAPVGAATLAGVLIEPTLRVGSQTLELVSCGVRDTLWIDHYVAGLYLAKGDRPQAAKDETRPKAVRLKVVNARYLPEDIPEKWRRALKSELAQEPMVQVRQAYDRISDGDVITFTYLPQRGVAMLLNGEVIMRTPGHAVIDSILQSWSGDTPVGDKLGRLTLEHPC